jgi:hypothetical protein
MAIPARPFHFPGAGLAPNVAGLVEINDFLGQVGGVVEPVHGATCK